MTYVLDQVILQPSLRGALKMKMRELQLSQVITYRLYQTPLLACFWIWSKSSIFLTLNVYESELCQMIWVLSTNQMFELVNSLALLQMTVHEDNAPQSFLIFKTVKYHSHLLVRHGRIIDVQPLDLKLWQPLSHALLKHVCQVLCLFDAQLPILDSNAIVFYDANEKRSREQMLLFALFEEVEEQSVLLLTFVCWMLYQSLRVLVEALLREPILE